MVWNEFLGTAPIDRNSRVVMRFICVTLWLHSSRTSNISVLENKKSSAYWSLSTFFYWDEKGGTARSMGCNDDKTENAAWQTHNHQSRQRKADDLAHYNQKVGELTIIIILQIGRTDAISHTQSNVTKMTNEIGAKSKSHDAMAPCIV